MAKLPKREQAWTGDRNAVLVLEEAIKQVKANATAKFDETVEIAVNLGVDPRHADQQVRGVVSRGSRHRRRRGPGRAHPGRLHGVRPGDRHAGYDGPCRPSR